MGSELPVCPDDDGVAVFLQNWSERKFTDEIKNSLVEKVFGLSRAGDGSRQRVLSSSLDGSLAVWPRELGPRT